MINDENQLSSVHNIQIQQNSNKSKHNLWITIDKIGYFWKLPPIAVYGNILNNSFLMKIAKNYGLKIVR